MIDWRTDENDEQIWVEPVAKAKPPNWRLWIAVLLVVATVGTWAGFQINARIQENIQRVRDQVRREHFLFFEAALMQDAELFDHLNAPSDIEWRAVQRLLLRDDVLLNKAPLNIWVDTAVSPPTLDSAVNLSADLSTATVQTIVPYLTKHPDGGLEPIQLRQTSFYKNRNSVWYAAEPPQNYWGTSLQYEGERLHTFYPDRDKRIVRRFAEDLDAFVVTLCEDERLHCPTDVPVRLLLQTDQTAVYRLTDNYRIVDLRHVLADEAGALNNVITFELPTPSLIGYPMDEASYQALYRGYASWIGLWLLEDLAATPQTYADHRETLAQYGLLPPAVAGHNPTVTAVPPIPLPDESLYIVCADGSEAEAILFDVQSETFSPIGAPYERFITGAELIDPAVPDGLETTLLNEIPLEIRPLRLQIIGYTAGDGKFGIVARSRPRYFFFSQTEDVITLLGSERVRWDALTSVSFEGNGRFLTIVTDNVSRKNIYLFDTDQTLERQKYQLPNVYAASNEASWSKNGRWLALIGDRDIRLIAPEFAYQHVIYHDIGGCSFGQWTGGE